MGIYQNKLNPEPVRRALAADRPAYSAPAPQQFKIEDRRKPSEAELTLQKHAAGRQENASLHPIQREITTEGKRDKRESREMYDSPNKGQQGKEDLSYHHVIDYENLKDFWNAVVSKGKDDKKKMKTSILDHMTDKSFERWGGQDEWREDMNASVRSKENVKAATENWAARDDEYDFEKGQDKEKNLQYREDLKLIEKAYDWQPWNLVHGPTKRTDDAHGDLDRPLEHIVSDWTTIKKVYDDIQAYPNKGEKDERLDLIGTISTNIKTLDTRSAPYPYAKDEEPGKQWERADLTGGQNRTKWKWKVKT